MASYDQQQVNFKAGGSQFIKIEDGDHYGTLKHMNVTDAFKQPQPDNFFELLRNRYAGTRSQMARRQAQLQEKKKIRNFVKENKGQFV